MPNKDNSEHQQDNQDRRALNSTILSLLEENRDDMKHLHTCMHETKDIVSSVQQHFIGISPEDHIRDHSVIAQQLKDETSQKIMFRNILGTIIGAILIGISTWAYNGGSGFLSEHVTIEYTQKK
jgi:hypothetical protein